jgi:FkbM family methyltransferase
MNLFRTISTFFQNPYVNPYTATLRHLAWQCRKLLDLFPYELSLQTFKVCIADRSIANGPGALLNAMGYYDPNNMYFLQELFEKKLFGSFFDIGSNIGIYALLAASTGNADVFAFEPHPHTFSLLQENITLNSFGKCIQSLQTALGEEDGVVDFTDQPGSAVNHIAQATEGNQNRISVKLIRGDTYCLKHDIIPDVVKIDVEGYENSVLRGFGFVLKDVKLIFVECRTLNETRHILCDRFNFLGPYKLDYQTRKFTNENINYEDWIFVNAHILSCLNSASFLFETSG